MIMSLLQEPGEGEFRCHRCGGIFNYAVSTLVDDDNWCDDCLDQLVNEEHEENDE